MGNFLRDMISKPARIFLFPRAGGKKRGGNTVSGRVPLHITAHPAALVRYTVIDRKTVLKGQRMTHTAQRLCIALIGLDLCILPVAAEDSLATILSPARGKTHLQARL